MSRPGYPIELRHPDGGSLLFHDLTALIDYFFTKTLMHQGHRMLPVDFHLYVNGRQYDWAKSCQLPHIERTIAAMSANQTLRQLEEAHREHLEYVFEIERAFYDALNIPHEDKVPGHPDEASGRRARR